MMSKHREAILCSGLIYMLATQMAWGQSQPGTFTGRVVDDQGQEISGAQVRVLGVSHAPQFYPRDLKVITETTTSSDGTFTLPKVDYGEEYYYVVILAKKVGYAWGWSEERLEEAGASDIVLGAPADLRGLVVDETGAPVPGAELCLAFAVVGERERRRASMPSTSLG